MRGLGVVVQVELEKINLIDYSRLRKMGVCVLGLLFCVNHLRFGFVEQWFFLI